MKLKAAAGWAFILLGGTSVAYAGEVYKCKVSGVSVYQDVPCAGASKIKVRDTSGSSQAANSSGDLSGLYRKIIAARDAERRLQSDMDRDIANTKARLGSKVNDPSSNGEAERIRNEWIPKIQTAQRNSDALKEELRRRCPRGAALNESSQSCNK